MLEKISSRNFSSEILQSELPVLLDFYSTWCISCRMLLAELERISEKCSDRIRVCRVNVENEPELAAKYRIYEIPTVIFFRDGRPSDRFIGFRSAEEIENMISKI